MIHIIDYRMGNIASITNMLKKIGCESKVVTKPAELSCAEKIILPGVGAFDYGMKNLRETGFEDALKKKVFDDEAYLLGICLGMQLLTNGSDEGDLPGLGFINADTVYFGNHLNTDEFKIPHMGWNYVKETSSPLFKELDSDMRFYFVHSYFVQCQNEENSIAKTEYGINFTSAVNSKKVYGVQFHPEKSHRFGMQVLKNYGEIQ